jgi:hypothetical protein
MPRDPRFPKCQARLVTNSQVSSMVIVSSTSSRSLGMSAPVDFTLVPESLDHLVQVIALIQRAFVLRTFRESMGVHPRIRANQCRPSQQQRTDKPLGLALTFHLPSSRHNLSTHLSRCLGIRSAWKRRSRNLYRVLPASRPVFTQNPVFEEPHSGSDAKRQEIRLYRQVHPLAGNE